MTSGGQKKQPEWVQLASSNLESALYDPDSRILTIRFHSGGEYQYSDVEPEVAKELTTTPRPGRYFADYINGRYAYE